MKLTKESVLKSLNSLTMPAWIKRVFQLIVDYIDDAASSIDSKADLVDGKVPIEQLPSYVDDVVEFQSIISYSGLKGTIGNAAYKDKLFFVSTDPYKNKFVNTKDNTAESDWEIIDPEDGKIYINITDNHSYRWTGSTLLDLDKEFSNGINVLNNIVKVANIGTVSNLDDIAEGDQSNIDQNGMSQLFSFLFNYKSYRNSYIQFENEDLDGRLCRIIDINGGKRQFTIYNNGALQTYKQLNTGGKYSLEKISSIPGYVYFDYNDASINKIAANSLKTNKAVPALLVMDGYVFTGYCTKVNEDTTTFIVFNKQAMETYYMNNLTGRFTFINTLDTDTIVNYDSIRGSKTNAEAKQELINILAGDTVVIDASKLGTTLTNEEAATVQKATTLIVTNIPNIGTIVFNRGDVTNTEIHFTAVSMAFMGSTYAKAILYSKNAKVLTKIQARTANPFQWYLNNGGIIAVQADFTALNNFLYDHTFIIDKTLLNTTISDTAIQNGIKRANILVVKDSTDNSYVLYIKGVANTNSHFFYNINAMISTSIDIKRIEFKISINLLSAGTIYFSSAFKSYQLGGGTKYTTESAFNTQFAKVMDMTVTQ